MTTITFTRAAEYACVGRNGMSQAHGLNVQTLGDDVAFQQVNSKGDLTNCRIVLPREHAAQLAAELLRIDGDAWTYDVDTRRVLDANGLKVAEGVLPEDAATMIAATRLFAADYRPAVVRAARDLLDALDGVGAEVVVPVARALRDAVDAA